MWFAISCSPSAEATPSDPVSGALPLDGNPPKRYYQAEYDVPGTLGTTGSTRKWGHAFEGRQRSRHTRWTGHPDGRPLPRVLAPDPEVLRAAGGGRPAMSRAGAGREPGRLPRYERADRAARRAVRAPLRPALLRP